MDSNRHGCSTNIMRAAIALGSNLGDRLVNLQNARDRIRALDGATGLTVQSAIYETSPVDCEPGAQNFYNAVIEVGFEKSSEPWEGSGPRPHLNPLPRGEEDAKRQVRVIVRAR